MTIDEIVEYVMNTPDNTNERVLRDMLNQLSINGEENSGSTYTTYTVLGTSGYDYDENIVYYLNTSPEELRELRSQYDNIELYINGDRYELVKHHDIYGAGQDTLFGQTYVTELPYTNRWGQGRSQYLQGVNLLRITDYNNTLKIGTASAGDTDEFGWYPLIIDPNLYLDSDGIMHSDFF